MFTVYPYSHFWWVITLWHWSLFLSHNFDLQNKAFELRIHQFNNPVVKDLIFPMVLLDFDLIKNGGNTSCHTIIERLLDVGRRLGSIRRYLDHACINLGTQAHRLDKHGRWQRLPCGRELASHHAVHALWWRWCCRRAKVVRCHLVMCKKHVLPCRPPFHHVDKWQRCDDAKAEVLFDLVADLIPNVLHLLEHGSEERINTIKSRSWHYNIVRVLALNLRVNQSCDLAHHHRIGRLR